VGGKVFDEEGNVARFAFGRAVGSDAAFASLSAAHWF
jgi:hypothetical protein